MPYLRKKYSSAWSFWPQSFSSFQSSATREEPRQVRKLEYGRSPNSSTDKMDVEIAPQEVINPGREPTDAKRDSEHRGSEHASHDMEKADSENVAQQEHGLSQPSEGVRPRQSSATDHVTQRTQTIEAPDSKEFCKDAGQHVTQHVCSSPSPSQTRTPASNEVASESIRRQDVDTPHSLPSESRKFERLDVSYNTYQSVLSQKARLSKRYDALSREHDDARGELQRKIKLLGERDSFIRCLKADIVGLQQKYEEQSSALASVRDEYRSCQTQLDNVQRFVSTADAHADQDLIQKLQELNEEVYQTSMTMADYLVEGFSRSSATTRQMTAEQSVLETIGQVMLKHLAAVEGDEDIALFLQIAFQSYFSQLLHFVVSSWTVDQNLNALIEGTYQRIRKAETQAISGRWRSLARTHILPTPVNDSKDVVKYIIAGLSDITVVAGFVLSRPDAESKLSSKFGEKVGIIVSHAGTFGNMLSGMISGDFEVFVVQPGVTFNWETMTDMNEDQVVPHATGAAQTVLCASRVGLRKLSGEKTLTLTKAQVVLESFLG